MAAPAAGQADGGGGAKADRVAEEKLHPELQRVGQRDLGHCCIDCNLQPRAVDFAQSTFNDPVILRIRIYDNDVVGAVRRDTHVLEHAAHGPIRRGV
jgi:hypothetical protein